MDDLLTRARGGDRDAENRLFRKLHARVLAAAKKRVWDADAAEDIAQETIRTVLAKYKEADLAHGLIPWVLAVLRNKVGNYLKGKWAQDQRTVSPEEMAKVSDRRAGEEAVELIELEEAVAKALRRASPECRRLFRLLLADADREEIRRAFGDEAIGTTYSRVSRCRDKLLRELERLGGMHA